jgi:hypothetical protein
MYPKEVGGFFFVPPSPKHSPSEIISRVLDTLTAGATFKVVMVGPYGKSQEVKPPGAAALAELARVGQGFVLFDLPQPIPTGNKQPGSLTFAPHPSGYFLVGVAFDTAALRAFDASPEDRASVEDIYERWVRCCERLGVEYAYFGRIGMEHELKYAEEELAQLLRKDVKALVGAYASYWLFYFGAPYLAEPAKALKLEEPEMSRQELPSGAVVIRTGEFPLPF